MLLYPCFPSGTRYKLRVCVSVVQDIKPPITSPQFVYSRADQMGKSFSTTQVSNEVNEFCGIPPGLGNVFQYTDDWDSFVSIVVVTSSSRRRHYPFCTILFCFLPRRKGNHGRSLQCNVIIIRKRRSLAYVPGYRYLISSVVLQQPAPILTLGHSLPKDLKPQRHKRKSQRANNLSAALFKNFLKNTAHSPISILFFFFIYFFFSFIISITEDHRCCLLLSNPFLQFFATTS